MIMTMILMVKVKSKCMIMRMMTNYDDNGHSQIKLVLVHY